jgi:hypothetical protein
MSIRARQAQDYVNTLQVLQDVRSMERRERAQTRGATGFLHRADVSCVNFMDAHPDSQLLFAKENGLFPDE